MKPPANSQDPVLLVDVDGVISLFGFQVDKRPDGTFLTVDGIPHYLSATAGDHLRVLNAHFELIWCTGWEERANEYLVHALELPAPLHHLSFDGSPNAPGRHWKLNAIEAHVSPHRPLAWIDDDHDVCHDWALERPGPTLLVTSDPQDGIPAAHVDVLVAWAAGLRAA
jgi:hypothetical protein